jgi:hypothetical protein
MKRVKKMTVTLEYYPAEHSVGLYPFAVRFGRGQWKLSAPAGQKYKAAPVRVAATLREALDIIGQEFENKS